MLFSELKKKKNASLNIAQFLLPVPFFYVCFYTVFALGGSLILFDTFPASSLSGMSFIPHK